MINPTARLFLLIAFLAATFGGGTHLCAAASDNLQVPLSLAVELDEDGDGGRQADDKILTAESVVQTQSHVLYVLPLDGTQLQISLHRHCLHSRGPPQSDL